MSLERQNKKLSILYELALTVSKSLNLTSILNDALERIIDFMEVDAGVIYVIKEETMEMIPVAFRNLSEEVVRDLTENRVKVGECMCGSIAQFDCEVVINEKASQDSRFSRESLRREGMEFYAGLPLKAKGKVVGVLCVITHTPYSPDPEMMDVLRAATAPISLAIENARLFEGLLKEVDECQRYLDFSGIITTSPVMKQVMDLIRKVLNIPSSILIHGESGTGKELIARAIHFNSMRRDRPFVPINCASVPESLLESELFGYVKGAFTGADTDKKGLFEASDGGTIFLDEINSISTNLQVKLLRFLQDRTFYKVGSTRAQTVDVRIIAATNQDPEEAIESGSFRKDLYYRLNVIRIDLPPLRERKEDIPLLVRYFINKYNRSMQKNVRGITEQALSLLMDYHWPGNVRELENTIQHALIMTDSMEITIDALPKNLTRTSSPETDLTLESVEKQHIKKVLSITGGRKKKAAELLGIDPATLWRKLKKYNLIKD